MVVSFQLSSLFCLLERTYKAELDYSYPTVVNLNSDGMKWLHYTNLHTFRQHSWRKYQIAFADFRNIAQSVKWVVELGLDYAKLKKTAKKLAHLEVQILSFGTSKSEKEPFKSFRYHFVVITMLKDEKIVTLISYQNPTVHHIVMGAPQLFKN